MNTPLGIVIVNYRTAPETAGFVKNEIGKLECSKVVIIVNNTFTPEEVTLLENELQAVSLDPLNPVFDNPQGIYLVNSTENLGFAKANNLGAFLLAGHVKPEYILFSNNDLEILSPGIADALAGRLEEQPDTGMIGPRIINHNGENLSPRFDKVSPSRFILQHLFYPIRALNVLSNLGIRSPGVKDIRQRMMAEGYCYWVSGTFFMVRTADFMAAGGFDPNTFLYCEEKILAERFARIGKKVYYDSNPVIRTAGGMTTNKYLRDKERDRILFRSEVYYYTRYFTLTVFQRILLRLSGFFYFHLYYPLYHTK
jgi:N-acetylglucosaminyl-diphospho-decaprenol L-rhamnosyltransferase